MWLFNCVCLPFLMFVRFWPTEWTRTEASTASSMPRIRTADSADSPPRSSATAVGLPCHVSRCSSAPLDVEDEVKVRWVRVQDKNLYKVLYANMWPIGIVLSVLRGNLVEVQGPFWNCAALPVYYRRCLGRVPCLAAAPLYCARFTGPACCWATARLWAELATHVLSCWVVLFC